MKHLGDITQIKGSCVPLADIVTGGSPCQDLSIAGQRKGLAGERSGLFVEQIRIIKEMRSECERRLHDAGADYVRSDIKPRYMVWENVPGAFSSNKGEDFRAVLEETAKVADQNAVIPELEGGGRWSPSGCILGSGWSIAWRLHDAQFWGVPQRRKRIALVADFGGSSAPEILFERKSVSGDSESSGEERQNASRTSDESTEEAISFRERAGCEGGAKESSFSVSEQEHCQQPTTKAFCIGGGQAHDAMTPSEEVSKTLNCMVDTMKIMTVSQDAYDQYNESSKSATIKQSGGVYGGGSEALVISLGHCVQGTTKE